MDGISYQGNTTIIFGTKIEPRWDVVGQGTNTIAYSYDGITWTPIKNSTSIFSNIGLGV
jgi:hypothetical protein